MYESRLNRDNDYDYDFDIERPELKIRSGQAALSIVDNLTLGDADLVSGLSLVTRRLETLRLKNVLQKSNRLF